LPIGGAALLVLLVLAVWLASGFYIVDEGRRGVVTRFGKYTETTQPGPRWHLPFPVEAVELVDFSQVKTIEIGYRNTPRNKVEREAVMLTDDENIIDIQFAVQYNLKSAEDYVFNNRRPDQMVAFIAETAIARSWQEQDGLRPLRGPRADRQADEQLMQQMLDRYGTGVFVQKVTLQTVLPPDKVAAAFDDAVKAGQDRERLKNEGQAYANDVVPRRPRHGLAPARGGERLHDRGGAEGGGRRVALPADPRRVPEGPGGDARSPLPRHDAVGARRDVEGGDRPEGRRRGNLLYLPLDG